MVLSFIINIVLEYIIACLTDVEDASYLGLLGAFFVYHCGAWIMKRSFQSISLLYWNCCDEFRVEFVNIWRGLRLILCLAFSFIYSVSSNIMVTDTFFWQLLLRWMVIQGILWILLFIIFVVCSNIWVIYRLYLRKYNFRLLKKAAYWKQLFIRSIDNSSNTKKEANVDNNDNSDKPKNSISDGIGSALSTNAIVVPSLLINTNESENISENIEHNDKIEIETGNNNDDDRKDARNTSITELESMRHGLKSDQHIIKSIANFYFKEIKFTDLLFVIVELDTTRTKWAKYLYIFCVWVGIIVTLSVTINGQQKLAKFAGAAMIMYYVIVVLRRGKYNCLYHLWKCMSHKKLFMCKQLSLYCDDIEYSDELKKTDTNNINHHKNDHQVHLLNPMLDTVKDMHSLIYTYKVTPTNENLQQASNSESNLFVETISFRYLEYWSIVETSESKDYFGCGIWWKLGKELCGICCLLIIILVFLILGIQLSSSTTENHDYWGEEEIKSQTPYPVCELEVPGGNFNPIDVVYLTTVVYYSTFEEIETQLALWFLTEDDLLHNRTLQDIGWDINNMYINDEDPTYFHIRNTILGVDLIDIRGTYDENDFLQDISLYTGIATLQMFSWIFPLTTVLPTGFIRDFIFYASIPEGLIDSQLRERFDTPVYDYINNPYNPIHSRLSKRKDWNNTILIIGHSLGGGIGEIVSSRFSYNGYTNIYSVGLSSPGVVWSSRKFGFDSPSIDRSCVSILPQRDPVSMVDKHGGLTQYIQCNAKNQVQCHSSIRSFCEIYIECNYARNVTFAECVCGDQNNKPTDWDKCW